MFRKRNMRCPAKRSFTGHDAHLRRMMCAFGTIEVTSGTHHIIFSEAEYIICRASEAQHRGIHHANVVSTSRTGGAPVRAHITMLHMGSSPTTKMPEISFSL